MGRTSRGGRRTGWTKQSVSASVKRPTGRVSTKINWSTIAQVRESDSQTTLLRRKYVSKLDICNNIVDFTTSTILQPIIT
jgi:hypothetical protein